MRRGPPWRDGGMDCSVKELSARHRAVGPVQNAQERSNRPHNRLIRESSHADVNDVMDDRAELGDSDGSDARRLVRAIPPLSQVDDEPTQDAVLPAKRAAAPRMAAALSHLRIWRLAESAHVPFYLMTVAAIIGAVITLRAATLASEAGESWARATREETLRDNYLARMSDYVFVGTAPFEIARVQATLF